jgi:hypothetical protein
MILSRRTKPRRGPVRNPAYLKFIRSLRCLICVLQHLVQKGRTEAAHSGPHGISQKSSDLSAIPLCLEHHQTGKDSYHRLGWRFFEYHGLDLEKITGELFMRWRSSQGCVEPTVEAFALGSPFLLRGNR